VRACVRACVRVCVCVCVKLHLCDAIALLTIKSMMLWEWAVALRSPAGICKLHRISGFS